MDFLLNNEEFNFIDYSQYSSCHYKKEIINYNRDNETNMISISELDYLFSNQLIDYILKYDPFYSEIKFNNDFKSLVEFNFNLDSNGKILSSEGIIRDRSIKTNTILKNNYAEILIDWGNNFFSHFKHEYNFLTNEKIPATILWKREETDHQSEGKITNIIQNDMVVERLFYYLNEDDKLQQYQTITCKYDNYNRLTTLLVVNNEEYSENYKYSLIYNDNHLEKIIEVRHFGNSPDENHYIFSIYDYNYNNSLLVKLTVTKYIGFFLIYPTEENYMDYFSHDPLNQNSIDVFYFNYDINKNLKNILSFSNSNEVIPKLKTIETFSWKK